MLLFQFVVSSVAFLLTFNAVVAAGEKVSVADLKRAGAKAVRNMLDRLVPEPDFAKLAATKALRSVDVTAYTTGYAYIGSSTSSKCSSTPVLVTGTATNVCLVRSNFAYKVQLTEDSCNNLVVEYFLDKECMVSAGTGPANAIDTSCQQFTDTGSSVNLYGRAMCTTSSSPPVFSDSVVNIEYTDDVNCTSTDTIYSAYAQNACLNLGGSDSLKYTCNSDVPSGSLYLGSTCTTLISSSPLDTTCQASSVADDDRYSTVDDDSIVAPPSASTTSFPTLAPAPVPVGEKNYCQAKNAQWNSASSVGSLKGTAFFGIVLGTFATIMSLWA